MKDALVGVAIGTEHTHRVGSQELTPRFTRGAVVAAAVLSLAACRGVTPRAPALPGSSWRLVEIQSMDDARGTTRPVDSSKYTITFGASGRLTAQLDCNRASGMWKSVAEGQLEIGPLAVTRMFCPPPSLSDQLGTDLRYVRSYVLRDVRLYLSLMADGGILVWEPIDAPSR